MTSLFLFAVNSRNFVTGLHTLLQSRIIPLGGAAVERSAHGSLSARNQELT